MGGRFQRGAATLSVVMLLFFVMSLAAAYASRNLIFEQRTSANQSRYTQGFEAAEAGLEWATAMLAAGRIDDNCLPTTDPTKPTFRQRYLTIEVADATKFGNVLPVLRTTPGATGDFTQWAGCVFNGTSWNCSCPQDADLTLAAPGPAGSFPAFSVRFLRVSAANNLDPTSPGVVRVEVNGCADASVECLNAMRTGFYNRCATTLCAMLALHSAAKAAPVAAITTKGNVSGAMTVVNDVNEFDGKPVGGITIRSAGTINTAGMSLVGVGGTPGAQTLMELDPSLQDATLPIDSDQCRFCLFTAATGLWPAAYRDQPAALRIDCPAGCTSSAIATAAELNPGRILWLRGGAGFTMTGATDIGSPTSPVFMVVDGPVVLSASSSARIHGVVYSIGQVNLNSGGVRGAIYATGDVVGAGGAEVSYDANVLRLLRLQSGSFVKVPGSWRDFP